VFSCWPTAVADPANGTPEAFLRRKRESVARGSSMGICLTDLQMVAVGWPSPNAQDGHRGQTPFGYEGHNGGENIHTAAINFPPDPWGTPRAADVKGTGMEGSASHLHKLDRDYLDAQVVSWPEQWQSPPATLGAAGCSSRSGDRIGEELLAGQAKAFPPQPWQTPRVTTGDYTRDNGQKGEERLSLQGESKTFPSSPPPEMTGGDGCGYSALIQLLCQLFHVETEAEFRAIPKQLNPLFVEFLMGWPRGWSTAATASDSAEMASCGRPRPKPLCGSGSDSTERSEVA
jgi:hypothetical protein